MIRASFLNVRPPKYRDYKKRVSDMTVPSWLLPIDRQLASNE